MDTNFHQHFGLSVRSELALPIPSYVGFESIDVDIRLGHVLTGEEVIWRQRRPEVFTCSRSHDRVILEWSGMRFSVASDEVVVDAEDVESATLSLIQATWSVLLTANGREALHASVVARDGRALAVMGTSGSGKSTAALRLLERGWGLVTDDLLTFDRALRPIPGPPFVRLTHEQAGSRPGEWDASGKLRYRPAICDSPVQLSAIIVHTEGCPSVEQIFGTSAVDALLCNVYNDVITHAGQSARRLQLALKLAERIPIYRVPPRSLSGDMLERIAADAYQEGLTSVRGTTPIH